MSETQAASSPAVEDVFGGQEPTMAEYTSFRETGELPARFKPAEPAGTTAPADPPEQKVETPASDPDSDPDDVQEPPKGSPAQKRILQLLARTKELETKLAQVAKPDAAPAPSPEQPQQTGARTKPTVDATDKDGKPKYTTYEDYVEDLADWKAEQQVQRFQQAQHEQVQLQTLKSKLDETRTRYADADTVIFPAAQAIRDAQIAPAVKEIFAQSEHFIDLCYKVGSDPAEMAAFIALAQNNPRAALAKVFEYEREIAEKLTAAGSESTGKAPEKKQTTAPKPPSPVTGATSRAFDVSDETLSADEWQRRRNKQLGIG